MAYKYVWRGLEEIFKFATLLAKVNLRKLSRAKT